MESKTELVTENEEAVKSELTEPLQLANRAVAGDDTDEPAVIDNPAIDLTLSSCEYVPAGEFW